MRIKADFELDTNWLIKDYRRIFVSLIKSIFTTFDPLLINQLYGTEQSKRKVNKPFTFSVYFPDFKKIESDKVICGNKVNLIFSSNNELLVTAFYNGLKSQTKRMIGINDPIGFTLKYVSLLPNPFIKEKKVLFRSLSPILVSKENTDRYIDPTNPEFDHYFKMSIMNQAATFNVPCRIEEIAYEIKSMKKLPLTHYHQTMTSWLGEFVLEAPIEVLQLVYDTGIGVRRSQGFGMLEVIKTF
jgi:CRISPR-associated endoribonuclease Cas6